MEEFAQQYGSAEGLAVLGEKPSVLVPQSALPDVSLTRLGLDAAAATLGVKRRKARRAGEVHGLADGWVAVAVGYVVHPGVAWIGAHRLVPVLAAASEDTGEDQGDQGSSHGLQSPNERVSVLTKVAFVP